MLPRSMQRWLECVVIQTVEEQDVFVRLESKANFVIHFPNLGFEVEARESQDTQETQ